VTGGRLLFVKTIDSLVFDLETEADVLRAVSRLEPEQACQLLLDVVRKIRQATPVPPAYSFLSQGAAVSTHAPPAQKCGGGPVEELEESGPPTPAVSSLRATANNEVTSSAPPEEVGPPGPFAAPPAHQSRNGRPNRTQTILNVLKNLGPMTRVELKKHVCRAMGEELNERNKNRVTSQLWWLTGTSKVLTTDDGLLYLPGEPPPLRSGATSSSA
jgi:hypothetical protein